MNAFVASASVLALGAPVEATEQTEHTGERTHHKQQPDAKLLYLERDLVAAHARMKKAEAATHEPSERYARLRPPEPEAEPPAAYRDLYRTITAGQMDILPADHPLKVWERETWEERQTARAAWRRECNRIATECGIDRAEATFNRRLEVVWKIQRAIFRTPAQSMVGLQVKARVCRLLDMSPDQDMISDAELASILRDILALGGHAAPLAA